MAEGLGFTHAVVEVMGHRRLAGRVTQEEIAGTTLLRVDVPAVGDQPASTHYVGGGSIYALHPCSEEAATRVAALGGPAVVELWELPQLKPPAAAGAAAADEYDPYDPDVPL